MSVEDSERSKKERWDFARGVGFSEGYKAGHEEGVKDGRKKSIGRWVQERGVITPGGTPCYVCGRCGGSQHLYGVEFNRRKVICDNCGRVNIYPYERAYEQTSSLWDDDNGDDGWFR